jgi:hypothetical protein
MNKKRKECYEKKKKYGIINDQIKKTKGQLGISPSQ